MRLDRIQPGILSTRVPGEWLKRLTGNSGRQGPRLSAICDLGVGYRRCRSGDYSRHGVRKSKSSAVKDVGLLNHQLWVIDARSYCVANIKYKRLCWPETVCQAEVTRRRQQDFVAVRTYEESNVGPTIMVSWTRRGTTEP